MILASHILNLDLHPLDHPQYLSRISYCFILSVLLRARGRSWWPRVDVCLG